MKLRPPKPKSDWPEAFRHLHEADVSEHPDLAELYKKMKADMKPMSSGVDMGEGLSDIEIHAARSTARVAARAKRLTNRWRGR